MLQALREKSSGWIATIILGLLIVPFAFFGMEQYLFQRNDTFAAKIEAPPTWWKSAPDWWLVRRLAWQSEEISVVEFQTAFDNAREQARAQQGEAFDARAFESAENKREVLEDLIDARILRFAAGREGFVAGNTLVTEDIASTPMFQADGRFDRRAYQRALSMQGSSPEAYEAEVRTRLQSVVVQRALQESAFVTRSETDRLATLAFQTRDVTYALLPPPVVDTATPIPSADVVAWYKANTSDFRAAESVVVEYVELDAASIPAPAVPSEAELRTIYERDKARFVQPEQRLTSHILVSVAPDANAADSKAAQDKANALAAKAKGGADFAALAREASDDAGSKPQGGDLGWVRQNGQMVKEFEDAVFAASPNSIVGPVKTQFGWHVIQVREVQAGQAQPFETARAEIERTFVESSRERAYSELASNVYNEVLKSPTALAPAARKFNLQVQRTGEIRRDAPTGLFATPAVLRAAFSDDVKLNGMVSSLIEVAPGRSVLIRVLEHKPERVQPIGEVYNRVVAAIRADRARKAQEAQADAILARVKKGESLGAIAAELQLVTATVPNVSRGMPAPDPKASQAYFNTQAPKSGVGAGKVAIDGGQMVVFTIDKVTPGDPATLDAQRRAGLVMSLSGALGVEDARALVKRERARMKVTVADDRL